MSDFLQKLTSRKFLIALGGIIIGVIAIAIGTSYGNADLISAGTNLIIACVVGYLTAEGVVDVAGIISTATKVIETITKTITATSTSKDAVQAMLATTTTDTAAATAAAVDTATASTSTEDEKEGDADGEAAK